MTETNGNALEDFTVGADHGLGVALENPPADKAVPAIATGDVESETDDFDDFDDFDDEFDDDFEEETEDEYETLDDEFDDIAVADDDSDEDFNDDKDGDPE